MADDEDSKEKRKLAAEKRRQKLLERGSNRLAFVTGETKKLEEDQGKPSVKRKNSTAKAVAAEVEALMPEEERKATGSVVEEVPDPRTTETKGTSPAPKPTDSSARTAEHSATQSPTSVSPNEGEEVSRPQSSEDRNPTQRKSSQRLDPAGAAGVNVLGASRVVLVVALALALGSQGILWSVSNLADRWMKEGFSQPILLQFLFVNSGSLVVEILVDSARTPPSVMQRGAGKIISRAGTSIKFAKQTLDAGALFFFVYILTLSLVSAMLELHLFPG
uniref:Uncharacterized protein n=1 Tax=Picocystis salinarum TaxID=88271 RepID=A0A7S3UFJ7_9CHLO|mmetsp:Transcript_1724/g.10635  ORF Transcript_1724/g.10635 Transcript_1724/m.10635 type:complete len:276 (-) Transcript_1724:334-1161(-)